MYQLSTLGFGPFFEKQLALLGRGDVFPARVAAEHRGAYEVWAYNGAWTAELAGRLRSALDPSELPGVGDWVLLRELPEEDRTAMIDGVLERRTLFTRGSAGKDVRTQVIAANVDVVFAVCGLDMDFNLRRIQRYLARIWASGAQPAVVLNKADLCQNPAERVLEVESEAPGVPVFLISALHSEGLDALKGCIRDGVTVALVGSSGAGKSTLVNALLGENRMATGEVRSSDSRGRHVTTHRQLVLLPGGGLLLDTPGMRELQLVDDEGLDSVFQDIAELASSCRYRDCSHVSEPGCAVREAVASGELPAHRLEHYLKLEKEAQSYALRQDEHKRRQAERVWGQLSDEVARQRRWRGGKP